MWSILGKISRQLIAPKPRLLSRSLFSAAGDSELLRPAAPYMMLPPSFILAGNMMYNFYSPIDGGVVNFKNRSGDEEAKLMRDDRTVLVGSSHGWLASLNSGTRQMWLSNPLSGRRVGLPPLAGKPFEDVLAPPKVIISCSPQEEENCRALMILSSQDKVVTCRPGRSNKWTPLIEWRPIFDGDHRFYLDFVYSAAQGKFFGLVQSGLCFKEELEGWDISTDGRKPTLYHATDRLHRLRIDPNGDTPDEAVHISTRYLVYEEMSDRLFLVRRYPVSPKTARLMSERVINGANDDLIDREKVGFDVYKIDEDGGLELCDSLDDLAMFVGINHSFAVRTSQFPQLKGNSIYFSDARQPFNNDDETIEIFDYGNRSCSPLYFDSSHVIDRRSMPWFIPSLG